MLCRNFGVKIFLNRKLDLVGILKKYFLDLLSNFLSVNKMAKKLYKLEYYNVKSLNRILNI